MTRKLFSRCPLRPTARRRLFRPRLEALEERTLLSQFGAPIITSTGNNHPVGLIAGDLNGDGKLDVVSVNPDNAGSNTLSVLLGTGDGHFTQGPGSPISVGTATRSITGVTGIFDGDNELDLAIVNTPSGSVSIWLGDGKGGFTQAAGSPVGVPGAPLAIAAGDFNGDGKTDLAVANLEDTVNVFLGDGQGGFTVQSAIPVDGPADALAVGDFNHDGHLDLAVELAGKLDILLGDGTGGFKKTAASPLTTTTQALSPQGLQVFFPTTGSNPALVVAGQQVSNPSAGGVQVLLGDGTGGFTVQPVISLGSFIPVHMAVADFNGDLHPDLFLTDPNQADAQLLRGDGTGGFTAAGSVAIDGTTQSQSVVAGDFNGDGRIDVAIARSQLAQVDVLLNSSPAPTTTLVTSSLNPSFLGEPVTFTAAVRSAGGVAPTAGSVMFMDGNASLGSASLDHFGLGRAVFTTPTPLPAGSHTITAVYSGDNNAFQGSTSPALIQTVFGTETFVWSGSGFTNTWSYGGNWVGGLAPLGAGERLVFPADAAGQAMVNDLVPGSYFDSITFTPSARPGVTPAYALIGNGFTLGPGGITDKEAAGTVCSLDVPITLGGPAGLITVQNAGADLVMGPLSDSGSPTGLVKSGRGTLTLGNDTLTLGNDSYRGPTAIQEGTVAVTDARAFGDGQVFVGVNATLELNSGLGLASFAAALFNPLVLSGVLRNQGTDATWFGRILLADRLARIDVAGGPLTLSGTVSGRYNLQKTGTGTLLVFGRNSMPATDVQAGTVSVQTDTALGRGPVFVENGARVELNGEFSGDIHVTNSLVFMAATGTLRSADGDNTWAGPITLNKSNDIEVQPAGQLLLSGSMNAPAGISPGTLTKTGAGSLVLRGVDTATNGTRVADGELDVLNARSLGSGLVRVDPGATLALDVPSLLGRPTVFRQAAQLGGTGDRHQGALHTLGGNYDWTGTVSLDGISFVGVEAPGTLRVSGAVSGDGSLSKVGTGTLALLAANTYTGMTSVLAGTLSVRNNQALGSIVGQSMVVYTGAVLQVTTPRVNASVTLLGGTLETGGQVRWEGDLNVAAPSTVTVDSGALQLTGFISGAVDAALTKFGPGALQVLTPPGSVAQPFFNVQLSGSGPGNFNRIVVQTGTIDLGTGINSGVLTVSLGTDFTPALGAQFKIIDNQTSSKILGTFFGLAEGATFDVDGFTFQITYRGGDGNDVVITRIA
jgi:autotransporter-associated beta strand protein